MSETIKYIAARCVFIANEFMGAQLKKFTFAVAIAAVAATPTLAADMAVKAPPPAPVPAWSWTGAYIGGNIGGAWDRVDYDWRNAGLVANGIAIPRGSPRASGLTGGGQIGFQQQWSNIVGGIEVSGDGFGRKGTSIVRDGSGGLRDFNAQVEQIVIVAGRLGIAWDRWLAYVKGGYAGAKLFLNVNRDPSFISFLSQTMSTQWMNGYDTGFGLDYALNPNVIVGAEFNYLSFHPSNDLNVQIPPTAVSSHENIRSSIVMATAHISWMFGVR